MQGPCESVTTQWRNWPCHTFICELGVSKYGSHVNCDLKRTCVCKVSFNKLSDCTLISSVVIVTSLVGVELILLTMVLLYASMLTVLCMMIVWLHIKMCLRTSVSNERENSTLWIKTTFSKYQQSWEFMLSVLPEFSVHNPRGTIHKIKNHCC